MKLKSIFYSGIVISALWFLRCLLAGTVDYYGFIVSNVFLAAIPLLLEPLFRLAKCCLLGPVEKLARLSVAAIWLLFLPNAFYILTDFMHLNSNVLVNARSNMNHASAFYLRGDGLYVLDSLLLLAATLFGAYVGATALLHAYAFFKRRLSRQKAIVTTELLMVLSAIGVYIGRYGRWNSWQGLIHPWLIATDLWDSIATAASRERFLTVVLTIFIFEVLSIWCVVHIHMTRKQK